MRPAERPRGQPVGETVGQDAGVALQQRFDLGRHRQWPDRAGGRRTAVPAGSRSGTWSTSQRRHRHHPSEHGVGQHRAAAVPAQQGDEDVRRRAPPSSPRRPPATRLRAAASRTRSGASARRAAGGSNGRSSGSGGMQQRARRQRCGAAALGHDGCGDRRQQPPGGRRPLGVGDGVGEQTSWQLRRIATIGAEQPDGDEFVPRVGERAPHAALTKLGSARGPTSIARSSRNTVSGTTPRGVHSMVSVVGCPQRRGEQRGDGVSPRRLRGDHQGAGAVGEHPVAVGTGDRRGDERRDTLEPRLLGEHGADSSHAPTMVVAALDAAGECCRGGRLDVGDGADERPLRRTRIAVEIGSGRRCRRPASRRAPGGRRRTTAPSPTPRSECRAATPGAPRRDPHGCRCGRRPASGRSPGRPPRHRPCAPATRTPRRHRRRGRSAAAAHVDRPGRGGGGCPISAST